ncbi:MAG: hypothetical protein Q7R87_01965 [Nanoarchaeota archaeon]|nr:hypothetical protein [Nanoarchaeota archaeon]
MVEKEILMEINLEKSKTELLTIGSIFFVLFIIVLIKSPLISYIIDIFNRSIGKFQTELIFGDLKVSCIFLLICSLSILFLYLGSKNKITIYRKNLFLIIIAILLGFILFTTGMFLIDRTLSPQQIQFNLLDNHNSYVGKIECYEIASNSKIILIDNNAFCTFKLSYWRINNSKTTALLTLTNGIKEPFTGEGYQIELKALANVSYISFKIYGKDLDNSNITREASVGYPFKFVSQTEYENKKKEFLTFVLGLLGLIFLSVPQFIIHLRDIFLE